MNAVTAFEHRKEALREQLEAAQSMQQALSACVMALEQTACELAQDEQDENARQRQQAVLAVARRAPSLLGAVGAKGQLVIREPEKEAPSAAARLPRYLQLAGVLALTGIAVYQYATGHTAMALIQAVGALLFVAGGLRVREEEDGERYGVQAQPVADAKAVILQLTQLCEAVDVCVGDLSLLAQEGGRARLSGSADEATLDLLLTLMEAKYSGREAMAVRSLDLAEEYLQMLGVEVVSYAPQCAAMFDALPTMGQARTVRPALVKDGKVIRRGVAACPAAQKGGAGA